MATGGYEGLRHAKAALEDNLISANDYEDVKVAFLRAQQIRAGFEAGFIKESDYNNIKRAFLNSLNLADPSSGAGTRYSAGASQSSDMPSNQGFQSNLSGSAAYNSTQAAPTEAATVPPSAAQTTPQASTLPSIGSRSSNPEQPPQTNGSAKLGSKTSVQSTGPDRFAPPANIPKIGGYRSKPAGASSMSGITVGEDAVNLYYYLKGKKAFKWAVWKLNSAGNQVVIDSVGSHSASAYQDFLSILPADDCRYAVVDMEFTNSEGCVFNKILFINWAPDNARMKPKMMYASTKDYFKGHLDGISSEIQGGDLDDVQESAAQAAVKANVTRL